MQCLEHSELLNACGTNAGLDGGLACIKIHLRCLRCHWTWLLRAVVCERGDVDVQSNFLKRL